MKKLRLHTVAVLLFTATAFISCSNDDDNNSTTSKTEFVTQVTGPATGAKNQELSFDVTYAVAGDCGTFERTVETTTGNTKTIEVKVKYDKSKVCTQPTTQSFVYKFKATAAGTYILKFKKTATDFVTQTIVVN